MTLSTMIFKWKTELEAGGCKPTQARMAPDFYSALCDEIGVPEYETLTEIHGMRVKVSRNIKRGTVVIEEDAKTMHKRMKALSQTGREE